MKKKEHHDPIFDAPQPIEEPKIVDDQEKSQNNITKFKKKQQAYGISLLQNYTLSKLVKNLMLSLKHFAMLHNVYQQQHKLMHKNLWYN